MRGLTYFAALSVLPVALWLAGCGSSPDRQGAGFDLRVLPSSFEFGGSADFSLEAQERGELVQVEVTAEDAAGLKAAYLELAYDTSRYTPLGAQSTGLLNGDGGRELLELSVTRLAGTVHHGQVLAHPESTAGYSGSGTLAVFTFARRALPRMAAAAPDTDFSETQLSWASPGVLIWRFASAGDYDQNGEVNVSDLSRLAVRLGNSVAPAVFPFDSVDSVADGDANGQVNIADITPIGANLGASLRKYLVYTSADLGDYPSSNTAASSVPVLGQVAVEDTADSPIQMRVSYSFAVSAPAEGAYFWVRPADGADNPGTPSNSVQYFTPNLSPVASLTPDQGTVPVGTTVTLDASGSSDPDGSIVKYEYDWDGSGTVYGWEDLALETAPTHLFDTAGSHVVRVRVTDDGGATGTAQTIVEVQNLQPPVADITADVTGGDAPLAVNLDASGSSDPDGSIANYLWDLDGDSVYETDTGLIPSAFFIYGAAGTYSATVQVTDDDGLTATANIDIVVTSTQPGAPTANLMADSSGGLPGITVNFDGSFSFDDGTIDKYEWDWEGDGTYDLDSDTNPFVSFTYNNPGDFTATLRVTDNDGLTDTAVVSIEILGGVYARLFTYPRYGAVPLSCNLDATESFSTDGAIVKYEFDWDGDGNYELDNGGNPITDHDYLTPGVYNTKVRVTDDQGGTSEKIMLVLATSDSSFPPDDSVFALPSQSYCQAGEAVGMEIYCQGSANPFQYVAGLRMTMPQVGNSYRSNTFNCGYFGNDVAFPDGVWKGVDPTGFLLPPDSFIFVGDIGGGQDGIDLNVVPLNGDDVLQATGAICNFELSVYGDTTFGFKRFDIVSRTYYLDSNQAPEYYWANENVPGLPGIDVQ